MLNSREAIVIVALCILSQAPFFLASLFFLKRYVAAERRFSQEERQLERSHYNDGVSPEIRKEFDRRHSWAVLKPIIGMLFSQFMVGFVGLAYFVYVLIKLLPSE